MLFLERIKDQEFDYILMLVDLLHEFELGVWKVIFTHLMHNTYYAAGGTWYNN